MGVEGSLSRDRRELRRPVADLSPLSLRPTGAVRRDGTAVPVDFLRSARTASLLPLASDTVCRERERERTLAAPPAAGDVFEPAPPPNRFICRFRLGKANPKAPLPLRDRTDASLSGVSPNPSTAESTRPREATIDGV